MYIIHGVKDSEQYIVQNTVYSTVSKVLCALKRVQHSLQYSVFNTISSRVCTIQWAVQSGQYSMLYRVWTKSAQISTVFRTVCTIQFAIVCRNNVTKKRGMALTIHRTVNSRYFMVCTLYTVRRQTWKIRRGGAEIYIFFFIRNKFVSYTDYFFNCYKEAKTSDFIQSVLFNRFVMVLHSFYQFLPSLCIWYICLRFYHFSKIVVPKVLAHKLGLRVCAFFFVWAEVA